MSRHFKIFLGIFVGVTAVLAGGSLILKPEISYHIKPSMCSTEGYCERHCPVRVLEFKGISKSIDLSSAC